MRLVYKSFCGNCSLEPYQAPRVIQTFSFRFLARWTADITELR